MQPASRIACLALLIATPMLAAEEPDRETITLKLHVHFLQSDEPLLDAPPDNIDLEAFLTEVNQIWESSAIQFRLKRTSTYRVENAQSEERYAALFTQDEAAFRREGGRQFVRLLPERKEGKKTFHIVYLHTMPHGFGGRYLPDQGVVVLPQIKYAKYSRSARQQGLTGSRRVAPKVMAHELGHALSLAHERLAGNLMTSGPNTRGLERGTGLTDEQIETARTVASSGRPFIREAQAEATAGSSTPRGGENRQQPYGTGVFNEQQRASFAQAIRATQAEGQALTRQLAEARKKVQESGDDIPAELHARVQQLQKKLNDLRRRVLDRVRPEVTEEQRRQLRDPASDPQPRP